MAILGMDVSPFRQAANDAVLDAKSAGSEIVGHLAGVAAMGLTVAGGLEAVSKVLERNIELAEKARATELGSERLGVSIGRFEDLDRSAERVGTSIEAIYAAYRKLAQAAISAEDGNQQMIAAFSELGLSVDDLKAKSVDEIFTAISNNAKGAEMTVARLAAVMKTMGKSADELLPGLKSGAFLNVDPLKPSDATIKDRAQFAEDRKTLQKEAGSFFDFVSTIPGTLTGHVVGKFSHWLAETYRTLHGITAETVDRAAMPDLKTKTAAELKADKKADEDNVKSAKHLSTIEDELAEKRRRERMESMTAAEKILELKKEELDLQRRIVVTGSGLHHALHPNEPDTTADDKNALEQKLEDRRLERIRLEKEKTAADERVADRIFKLNAEAARINRENVEREMTAAERVAEIKKQIARIQSEMQVDEEAGDEELLAQDRVNLAKAQGELARYQKEADRAQDKAEDRDQVRSRLFQPEVNSLQRIGAYVNPAEVTMVSLAEKTEAHMKQAVKLLAHIDANANRTKF